MPKFTKQATQAKNAASDRVCAYKCKGLDSIPTHTHTQIKKVGKSIFIFPDLLNTQKIMYNSAQSIHCGCF